MDDLWEWLFNAPLLWLLGAALLAACTLAFGTIRADRRIVRVGLALVGVVAAWGLASYLVRTPLERAIGRVNVLADSFEGGDWQAFGKQIDPETRFYGRLKGQQITEAARLTHDALGTGEVRVLGRQSTREGEAITVTIRVLSEHADSPVRSIVTSYRFDFHRRAGEWKLEQIEPLATERLDPQSYLKFMVMPPGAGGIE